MSIYIEYAVPKGNISNYEMYETHSSGMKYKCSFLIKPSGIFLANSRSTFVPKFRMRGDLTLKLKTT